MEAIDTYLMYCAMKAHFGKTDYDFVTYHGKTRIKRDSFYKRKDRGFFVKISRKYKTEENIKNYFVSNFIKDGKGYVSNFSDENYEEWKDDEHPILLKEYLGKRVSLETLIVLDELVEFSKTWNKKLSEDYIWQDIKKLMNNYKRFLTLDKEKYRMVLLNLIEGV